MNGANNGQNQPFNNGASNNVNQNNNKLREQNTYKIPNIFGSEERLYYLQIDK